ncbi:MAG: hypothetical protein K1X55_16845 [Chitinophagales bacterium]|nr:hypothetical protein [Chitinophagales bacterium]
MKATIKNTLFRFATMRKPEKISRKNKAENFIYHSNPEASQLFAETPAALQTKLQDFEENALNSAGIIALNEELYDLALWVLQNRDNITKEQYLEKLSDMNTTAGLRINQPDPVTGLYDDELIAWDNFIYQVCTQQDQSAREAALVMIFGNHLMQQMAANNNVLTRISSQAALDTDGLRKVAMSRIVFPEFITKAQSNARVANRVVNQSPTILQSTQTNLRTALQSMQASSKLEALELLRSELLKAEKKFTKLAQQHQKAYDDAYKVLFDTWMEENTPEDPLEQPVYNYVPLSELDEERMESTLSPQSHILYASLLDESIDSFKEILAVVDEQIASVTQTVVSANAKQVFSVLKGTIVPVSSNSRGAVMTYSVQTDKVGNAYKFYLAVHFGDSTKVTGIDYSLQQGNTLVGQSNYATIGQNVNGVVNMVLFGNARINPLVLELIPESPTLSVTLVTDSNETISFDVEELAMMDEAITEGVIGGVEQGEEDPQTPLTLSDDTKYGVTRLGIAEYKKVEQSFCCNVPGEVSHIENIMAKEYKEKSTRRSSKIEESTTTESSSERESLTDTTTTERNEMNQEIAKVLQSSKNFSVNAGISGDFLGKRFSLDTSFSMSNSKEESNNLSKTQAKDITERAMDRIVSKTRTEQIRKVTEEYSEESKHGFDNRKGDQHFSGVYRWVDKIYKNEIFNYGKRLMYEFMIPEPARLHHIFAEGASNIVTLEKPVDPRLASNGISDFSKITEANYKIWASLYNAEVEAPPSFMIALGKSYNGDGNDGKSSHSFNDLTIPEGYYASKIYCTFNAKKYENDNMSAYVIVANELRAISKAGFSSSGLDANLKSWEFTPKPISSETIPVSLVNWDIGAFALNVNVEFTRKDQHFQQWQIKTFNAIINAYEEKLQDFNDKMQMEKSSMAEQRKINPLYFQDIIQTLLQKNCIAYLMDASFMGSFDFQIANATFTTQAVKQSPELVKYAEKVKFVEQAFEWESLSYMLYPFYWAAKQRWEALYSTETDDILFTKFLQSGMARVILTVRPGFEDAVNWFFETGQVWNGAAAPVIGNDLYLSIVDELMEPEYVVEGSWETRLPSSLTVIQSGSVALNATGLPCECTKVYDDEGNLVEGSPDTFEQVDTVIKGAPVDGIGVLEVAEEEEA